MGKHKNQPPTGEFLSAPYTATVDLPLTVGLSGFDPDGTIKSWVLAWGDGASSTGLGTPTSATHTYQAVGVYTLRLTVKDNGNVSAWVETSASIIAAVVPVPDPIPIPEPIPDPVPVPDPTPIPTATSPDGTMVPPASQIVDAAGSVWTIDASQRILRDGVQAGNGAGSTILWLDSSIDVLGTDGNWWQWTGSAWLNVGPTQPVSSTQPVSTPVVGISDYTVHVPPDVPVPPVGQWWSDLTFSKKIQRITDGSAENRSYRTQSAGACWNADSTRFTLLGMGGESHLYAWDGNQATLLEFASNFGEVTFSDTDPDLAFGIGFRNDEAVVRSYHLATKELTDVVGVRELVPGVDDAGRTYARDVGVFAGRLSFIFGGQSQDADHYVYVASVAAPKTGILIDTQALPGLPPFYLHGLMPDKSCRYIIFSIRWADIAAMGAPLVVWDIQANTFERMTASPGGHGVCGPGEYVNNPDDEDSMEYRWRSLAAVNTTRNLVQPYPTPRAFQTASHPSWCLPRHSVVSATYRYSTGVFAPWRPWDDELMEIDLNTGLVTRMCHHQSQVTDVTTGADFDYWSTPKPWVSPDGKWCLYTSNWRRSLGTTGAGTTNDPTVPRQDSFIVQLV